MDVKLSFLQVTKLASLPVDQTKKNWFSLEWKANENNQDFQ